MFDQIQIFPNAIHHNSEYCTVEYEKISTNKGNLDLQYHKVHTVCFDNEQKILLVHHDKWSVWGLPGGTVEDGENYIQTLTRECAEEAGVVIQNIRPFSKYKVKRFNETLQSNLLTLAQVTSKKTFEVDPAGSVSMIKWCDPEEALMLIEQKPFRQIMLSDAIQSVQRYANN